jgi:hypothetical protein
MTYHFYIIEKKGKIVHLLNKKENRKQRKQPSKVPVLGTLAEYKQQVAASSEQNQPLIGASN